MKRDGERRERETQQPRPRPTTTTMNSTVCFLSWIRRHRGVAGDEGAPYLALV